MATMTETKAGIQTIKNAKKEMADFIFEKFTEKMNSSEIKTDSESTTKHLWLQKTTVLGKKELILNFLDHYESNETKDFMQEHAKICSFNKKVKAVSFYRITGPILSLIGLIIGNFLPMYFTGKKINLFVIVLGITFIIVININFFRDLWIMPKAIKSDITEKFEKWVHKKENPNE